MDQASSLSNNDNNNFIKQIARVLVYVRPDDAIFMNIKLDNKMDPSEYVIRIKEEPIDPEICDDLSPVDTNTGNENETATFKAESLDDVYCKNEESAFPQESRYLENYKLNPNKRKSKHKVPSNNGISCSVCLLTFKTKHLLEVHNKFYSSNVFKCNNCTAIFTMHVSLIRHLEKRCLTKKLSGYRCNFCNRMFSYKRHMQSHLFHAHGNEIFSGESKITKTSPESLKKSNHSDGIVMAESNTSHRPSPKNVNSSINISLELSNSSNNTPTEGSSSKIKFTHPKWLNDSHDTPSKRMKQTILPDFISLYKDKPNDKCVIPEEVIDTENIPVTATITPTSILETFSNKTSTAAEIIQMSTSVKRIESPVRKSPFVQNHGNLKTMISSLRNEIKAESESSNTSHNMSYNLRSVKRCSSSLYDFYDLLEFETFGRSRQSFKRNKSAYIFNQSRGSAPEAKCKECVVRLEKCDKLLEPTSFVSNEDEGENEKENENEDALKQAVSKNVKEEFEDFRETSSAYNLPLKADTIASKRFNEFVKSFTDRLIVPQQESVEFQKNFKINQQKIFQCHICKKSFPFKENLREHMKLFHTIYMSSICNARYTSMNKLLTHYLRQHIIFKRRECCVCHEKFDTSALLKRHMILHCLKTIRSKKDALPVDVEINCNAFKKRHKCKGCRKRFWLYSCLKQHEKVCRRMNVLVNSQRVPCVNHLSRTLKEPSDMKLGIVQSPNLEQMLDVSGGTTRSLGNYLAPSTPIDTFSSSLDTAAENKRLHNGNACVKGHQADKMNRTKFPCNTCGTQFQKFKNLCIHEHTYCRTAAEKCNVCNTMFSTKRLLQFHMLATHTPSCSLDYKFFCKFCNQGFVKKSRLQIHERHFHIGQDSRLVLNSDCVLEDKRICNICHLLFESYERLAEHEMYYYKGNDFLCAICGKAFQGMYKFHHHNKLEHYPGEPWKLYPYKCDTCNEGFSYESHFHAHKLHVHSHDSSADETRDRDTSDQTN